ncbi:hypothetical protein ABZX50_34545 [Streptomyces misionensis]|uniref:hypothetical protein n=1 Tax=Streptomyces misionensis TaxID=67331 RepID=UPI0033A40AB7
MEPTESVAPDSRLRLRRRAVAWREILRPGAGRTRPRVRPAAVGAARPLPRPPLAVEPVPGLGAGPAGRSAPGRAR